MFAYDSSYARLVKIFLSVISRIVAMYNTSTLKCNYCNSDIYLPLKWKINLFIHPVFMWQESVSSVFGCGLSAACVVDVGDEKTSICCVEDGLVVPSSR